MEIFYIALCIPLLPATIALVKWKHLNQYQRWFAAMLWFILLVSFAGRAWTLATLENNLPFYYIYILGELLILLQVFKQMFGKEIKTWVWLFLSLLFSLAWIISVSMGKGWWVFPDYIRAFEAIIVLVIVILWFFKMLREKVILHPYKTFEFWICAGLLIYFSGNFLLFSFSKIIVTEGKQVFQAIWIVNAILNILLYLMYSIAFIWIRKTTK